MALDSELLRPPGSARAGMSTTHLSLVGLRNTLTELQRDVLDELWGHLVQQGESMPERFLRWKFGGAGVEALGPLGGAVVSQVHPGSPFELSLLGALLTSSGPELCSLLQRCITFVRDTYRAGRMPQSVSAGDVRRLCNLKKSQVEDLRLLLSRPETRTDFVVRAPLGAKRPAHPWDFFILDSVWQLRDVDDVGAYVDSWVMAGFDPTRPVIDAAGVPGTAVFRTDSPTSPRQPRQPEGRYQTYALEILGMLRGRSRIVALDLQILVESRFESGWRTVKKRTFEDYLSKWRVSEPTRELVALGMHDVGRWSETDEQKLQECCDDRDRRVLTTGRRKHHKKHRKY